MNISNRDHNITDIQYVPTGEASRSKSFIANVFMLMFVALGVSALFAWQFSINDQLLSHLATPTGLTGLGKITLEWEAPGTILLEDVLGYNMYRYELKSDNTVTDPLKLNSTLIGNINYSDFNVIEGKTYYYKYKILRTNFEETDYSKTVMASPVFHANL